MRITSGKFKNKKIDSKLAGNKQPTFRPTQSKIRAAIFNKLNFSRIAFEGGINGLNIMDLFCGCGTFGLEALSRNAAHIMFVDKVFDNINLTKKNVSTFGATEQCDLLCTDVTKMIPNRKSSVYDVVYMDPPYHNNGLVYKSLEALNVGNWLAAECIIIIEVATKQKLVLPEAFSLLEECVYGASKVLYVEKTGN